MKLVFCRQCGLLLPPGQYRCPRCGQVSAQTSAPTPPPPAPGPCYPAPPRDDRLTTARYLGALCLFWLPLVGLIPLLIFAAGGTRSQDLQRLAQAYLIRQVILSAAALVLAVLFVLGPNLPLLLMLLGRHRLL